MNFSLLIIIVMLAVVLPTLARRFFSQDNEKPQATYLEPVVENTKKDNILIISDVSDASLLLSPVHHIPAQKELISQHIKLVSQAGRAFRGYELLQALEDVGLKYGEKDLFYYVKNNETLFCVAPTASPYVFYLDEIGSLSTEGLEFVLKKNDAYLEMKKIVEKLSEELDGKIYEGN